MDPTPLLLFLAVCIVLMLGFPVAFSLAGTALFFALVGTLNGTFEPSFLSALPSRLYGIMGNQTLVAVPLFVFMGIMLERSKVAEELLESMSKLFGRLRGGLGLSVTLVGMLMAASTGIVGATVVTMGVLSLPTMLKETTTQRLPPAQSAQPEPRTNHSTIHRARFARRRSLQRLPTSTAQHGRLCAKDSLSWGPLRWRDDSGAHLSCRLRALYRCCRGS